MALTQIVYYSRRADGMTDQLGLLRNVLAVSQSNNARDGLTGFLVFDKTWFFQVIEGEREPLLRAFGRIKADPRHGEVTLMTTREPRSRSFPTWSMSGALRSHDQEELFIRNGIVGALDPLRLTAQTIIALGRDLQEREISRQQGLRAVG